MKKVWYGLGGVLALAVLAVPAQAKMVKGSDEVKLTSLMAINGSDAPVPAQHGACMAAYGHLLGTKVLSQYQIDPTVNRGDVWLSYREDPTSKKPTVQGPGVWLGVSAVLGFLADFQTSSTQKVGEIMWVTPHDLDPSKSYATVTLNLNAQTRCMLTSINY